MLASGLGEPMASAGSSGNFGVMLVSTTNESGGVAALGPLETTRFTAEPAGTTAPYAGLWLNTYPAGRRSLFVVLIVPTESREAAIAVSAKRCETSASRGTTTRSGTLPTVTLTLAVDAFPAASVARAVIVLRPSIS